MPPQTLLPAIQNMDAVRGNRKMVSFYNKSEKLQLQSAFQGSSRILFFQCIKNDLFSYKVMLNTYYANLGNQTRLSH